MPARRHVAGTAAALCGEPAVEAAGVGTFDWDLVTGALAWDERMLTVFGHDETSFDGTIEGFTSLLHPDDRDSVAAAVRRALDECGDFSAVYRIRTPGGHTRWISARGRASCDVGGVATRLLGAAHDVTDQRGGDLDVARVLDAIPAGFYALDAAWRFTHVNAEAERLLRRSRDQLLGEVIWKAFPEAVDSVFEESHRRAVATRRPVTVDAHSPAPLDGWYELRAWPTDDGLSVHLLEVTERVRAREELRRTADRAATVARISTELAGSMDAEVASGQVPRLAVPVLADACIVSVLDEHGRASSVSSWHADESARALLDRYARARSAALPSLPPVARAFTTGDVARFTGAQALATAPAGEPRELLTRLAPSAALALPLRGRGRTLGLLSLLYTDGRTPTAEEVATLGDVADRLGTALDNARLYGTQRRLALELQRSMLTAPPEPDHAEIAVRYLPAAEGAAVGGDWYDAFLQAGGATTLVIGDVVGHDSAAAATMGQLRSLLRGIAIGTGDGPAGVLAGLDRAIALLRLDTLATAAVARFEQTPAEVDEGVTRMRWSNAGHTPPVLVGPDGAVSVLRGPRADLLLGVDPGAPRREMVATLERGSTVLLYTDGLVERRDSDLDDGQARLTAALAELGGLPLQEVCDVLLERMVRGRPTDDVALVAVRLHRQDLPRPASAGPVVVPGVVPADAAARTTAGTGSLSGGRGEAQR